MAAIQAILVLIAVIRQHWGSHKIIQGATKEREHRELRLVQAGVDIRSQQNMIDVF